MEQKHRELTLSHLIRVCSKLVHLEPMKCHCSFRDFGRPFLSCLFFLSVCRSRQHVCFGSRTRLEIYLLLGFKGVARSLGFLLIVRPSFVFITVVSSGNDGIDEQHEVVGDIDQSFRNRISPLLLHFLDDYLIFERWAGPLTNRVSQKAHIIVFHLSFAETRSSFYPLNNFLLLLFLLSLLGLFSLFISQILNFFVHIELYFFCNDVEHLLLFYFCIFVLELTLHFRNIKR